MSPRKNLKATVRISNREKFIPFFAMATAVGFALVLRLVVTPRTIGTFIAFAHTTQGYFSPMRYRPMQEQVLPPEGFQTGIILGDVVQKMVAAGVLDQTKLADSYSARGGIPPDMQNLLSNPSHTPLRLTKENSKWLLNILWPVGLANKMAVNRQSPIAQKGVSGFASTGGWTLGSVDDGSTYFNAYPLIALTAQQEDRVKTIADTIHRPCCNNSAFFQDCNHGSAALGLVELGVLQGLSDEQIYQTVLHFNSFWFPKQYLEMAAFFQKTKGEAWVDVDPKLALSSDYSSISGWLANVDKIVSATPGLLPTVEGGSSCTT
jgi:hypothetical protein